MIEESPAKLRPAWVIGGAFGAILLGSCALIAVCSAAAIVWFSVQRENNGLQTTQTALQRNTEQAVVASPPPTRTPRGLPTILSNPPPTLLPMPSAISNARPAPDQAVRAYYQFVSAQNYDESWNLLTDAFKQEFNCCAPNYNYTGYVDWWNSVNYVDFGAVSTVSQSQDRAVVYAEIYFVMNNGQRSGVDSNPYIELLYDMSSGLWMFNDKRASP